MSKQYEVIAQAQNDVWALERKHSALMQVIVQVRELEPLFEAVVLKDNTDPLKDLQFEAALHRVYRMWIWLRDNEPNALDPKAR